MRFRDWLFKEESSSTSGNDLSAEDRGLRRQQLYNPKVPNSKKANKLFANNKKVY